nr:glycosyltransferase family 2 protein [uncultured Desulfobacter sp.]
MKISIIIPIYNVAQFVGRCLNSVISQTYPDIECVIVDDCGQDNSMEIVARTLSNYRGPIVFKLVSHEKNGGLSAARNTGTKAATGEYIYYLDSDDMILPDSLILLAELLKAESLDFVIGNYASGGNEMRYIPLCTSYNVSRSNQEILASYLDKKWYMMAVNKLINRRFFIENELWFLEDLIHEDELWSFQVACKANSMGVVNEITYIYCLHPGSIMSTLNKKSIDSWIRIISKMETFAMENGLLDNSKVIRFVTNKREALIHFVRGCGFGVAMNVYNNHVRGKSLFKRPWRSLTLKTRVSYLHHFLPWPIGYLYHKIACEYLVPIARKVVAKLGS